MERDIVIVDDDPITRMDVRGILESKGYNVVGEASDGFSAIDVCKKYKPSLVIMDVDMPNLDGIRTSKIITKDNLAGGIILLTGHEGEEYLEKATSVGAFGYLVKPIDDKSFIRNIEICLSKVSEFEKLKNDLDNVSTKLNERKIIERAKGILIKEFDISEDEAYRRIRKLCMDKRTTMAEIAKVIILGYED
ncbi:MAG: ANTAR domain-containing response regulator [Clostridium sp.]|uniref:ANTAR domain-containing response regulator n=1 Tax=Clostridium sp. TaxID=1506 RepID=UPI003F3C3362